MWAREERNRVRACVCVGGGGGGGVGLSNLLEFGDHSLLVDRDDLEVRRVIGALRLLALGERKTKGVEREETRAGRRCVWGGVDA